MRFFILPDGTELAFIPRTGSTAWSSAIINQFYPELKEKLQNVNGPNGKTVAPQFVVPSTDKKYADAVFMVMRNPIERFRSGFSRAANGRTVDELIDYLLAGNVADFHIRRVLDQFDSIKGFRLYKWETDLSDLAEDIGLNSVPDTSNESDPDAKPTLTDAQVAKLNKYYEDDIVIYNSIIRPGKPFISLEESASYKSRLVL